MGQKTYIDAINNTAREAVMRLYGAIGDKVDGDLFAQELAALDCANLNIIRIRTNSPGGNVLQGMSIVSAILSMKTPVFVHVDGIAASMAAVICVAADRVYMMDYAKMMIHDPYYASAAGKMPTPKQQKTLTRLTDMLRQVMSRRGVDSGKITKLMQEETWFSAEEAKNIGLCDEIEASSHTEYKNMDPLQLVAEVEANFQVNNQKPKKMKEVASKLGLSAEATEAEMLAAVTSLQDSHAREVATLKADKDKAEAEVKRINDEKVAAQKTEAKDLIAQAVKLGKITADLEATWLNLFEADFEGSKKALNGMPVRQGLRDRIPTGGVGEEYAKLSWDELDRKGLLAELKEKHPDLYEQKYKAMCAEINIQNQ